MQAFYSILYTPINPAIAEQISIAILVVDEGKIFFRSSLSKIDVLKRLIPHGSVAFIKQYVKAINDEVEKFHINSNSKGVAFPINSGDIKHFSEDYIDYLSRYNNNLITFSKPKSINIELNQENFTLLFEKFIHKDEFLRFDSTGIENNLTIEHLFHKINYKQYVNTNVERSNFDKIKEFALPRIVMPESISLIGKNEVYTAGQVFDFNKKSRTVGNELSKFINFQNEFDKNSKFFVIGEEPLTTSERQHKDWQDIRSYNKLTYVDISEIEEIENYLLEHDVKPIF